jgi:voltage-gated potassium channel Kch
MGWEISLSLVTVIIFAYLILRYVYKEGRVTSHRIQAAVAAYLLIALAFALGYHLTSFLIPGAITFPDKAPDISNPRFAFNFNYFSLVTITTLGYGDIIPVNPFARTLAMMEALVGQLYPAILLARLVSLYILHSQKSHGTRQEDDAPADK